MGGIKTDPDLDQIAKELVEWMDGWEWHDGGFYKDGSANWHSWKMLKDSLDIVREIEVAVYEVDEWMRYEFWIDEILVADGDVPSKADIQGFDYLTADPKPRLIALHQTLKESGEI